MFGVFFFPGLTKILFSAYAAQDTRVACAMKRLTTAQAFLFVIVGTGRVFRPSTDSTARVPTATLDMDVRF